MALDYGRRKIIFFAFVAVYLLISVVLFQYWEVLPWYKYIGLGFVMLGGAAAVLIDFNMLIGKPKSKNERNG